MSVALVIKVNRTQIPEVSVSHSVRKKNKEMPKSTADKSGVFETTDIRAEFHKTILFVVIE